MIPTAGMDVDGVAAVDGTEDGMVTVALFVVDSVAASLSEGFGGSCKI